MIELSDKQKQFVYSPHTTTCMMCGRSFGKSTAAAFLVDNRLTKGQSVLVVAPTYAMLRNSMIPMVQKILNLYGYKKGKHYSYNGSTFNLTLYDEHGNEKSTVYFRSSENYETIRSITDVSILVVDEAAIVDPECYNIAMACVRGKNVTHPQYFLVSTPRGRANYMSEIFLNEKTLSIKGTSYDNPNIARASIDNLVERYGEDFARQEIYAEILDSTSAGYFKRGDIDIINSDAEFVDGEIVFGFDIAGEGDDYSAITVLHGNQVVDMRMLKTPDDNSLVNFLQFMVHEYPHVKKVLVDKTGAGHIPSRLQGLFKHIQIIGVNFAAQAYKEETFANQRSEMYDSLRSKIRNNNLHFGKNISKEMREIVEVELYATEYHINNRRCIQLKEKKAIKKTIGRSPDLCDSLALACIDTGKTSPEKIAAAVKKLSTPKKYYNNKSANYRSR